MRLPQMTIVSLKPFIWSNQECPMPTANIARMGSDDARLLSEAPAYKGEGPVSKLLGLSIVLLLGSGALILRVYHLGARSIWYDESFSAMIAQLRWSQFLLVLWNREANMAFYYFILHFWERFGSNPVFLRSLSVICSVAAVTLTYLLGARLFDRKTGVVAAWLLAINAYDVRYAQEARSYALVVLLSVLSTWFLARNLQQPSRGWGAYATTNVLLVYSHFFGGLVIVAQLLSLLLLPRAAVPWRAIGRSFFWFAVFVIPIPLFIIRLGTEALKWIAQPNARQVLDSLAVMAGNGGRTLLVLSAVTLLIAGFRGWQAWQSSPKVSDRWPYALIFAWLIVPIAATLLASYAQPFFVPRFLLFCVPALLLGVAAGVTGLRPSALAVALFLTISFFMIAGTVAAYRRGLDDTDGVGDWPAATSYIFEQAQPGDGIFFLLTLGRVTFEYYRSQRSPTPAWPEALYASNESEMDWRDFTNLPLGDVLTHTRPSSERVWVVFIRDDPSGDRPSRASTVTRAVFAKNRQEIAERRFQGITVMLFAHEIDKHSSLLLPAR
jgi:mannosyltransferase